AAPAAPADEPAAVARLRALLGPDTALTYRSAETLDPARGSARLLGVSMDGRGRRVAMEELTLDGLRDDGVGEATARAVTVRDGRNNAAVARLRLAGLSVRRPPPGAEVRPDMVRLDALRIEGLRMTGASDATVAEFSVEEYGAGRTGRVSMSGFDMRVPGSGNRVAAARAAVRGLDLAAALTALAASEQPPRTPGGTFGLEVEGVSVRQGARALGGFGALRIAAETPLAGPESGTFALRDLRIEAFPGTADWLRRLGYDAVMADLTGESRFDGAAGRLELGSVSLAVREMGAIGLSMVLDGVSQRSAARRSADFEAARLVSATLRYVDQSLYARYVRQQARESRVPEEQVRRQHADTAEMMLGSFGQGAAGMDAVRAAVARFLRGEAREVEVTARPREPLPLGEMRGKPGEPPDAAVLDRLGLEAATR
ncbi:hypothetical protein, partial [Craurococcus roseus]|uniref:hypothetical protein n=1 Tax=Craurococcus roseus TaxID=77585 RepID=UPI0031D2F47C